MQKYDATAEEVEFLVDHRIELNAMTSRQFVDRIDNKLQQHDVPKVIPDEADITVAARSYATIREANRPQKTGKTEIPDLPDGDALRAQVADALELDPLATWDTGLRSIILRIK